MIRTETTTITLYSDSAPGQNKNTNMIHFCLWLAETFNVNVIQVFPVRGHSYCVCDRNFGIIRRQTKRCENVYTAQEYVNLIKTAKKKNGPFKVLHAVRMLRTWDTFFSGQFTKTSKSKGQPFKMKQYVSMKYRPDNTVLCSVAFNSVRIPFSFRKPNRPLFTNVTLETMPGRVSSAKVRDVLALLPYVPLADRKKLRRSLLIKWLPVIFFQNQNKGYPYLLRLTKPKNNDYLCSTQTK